MAVKKHTSLDRVLGRLDSLDSVNLSNLVQRLARERRFFEDVFDSLQEGVLVIGADGAIEYANAAAHRLVGVEAAGLTGGTLWKLIPGLKDSLQTVAEGGGDGAPAAMREVELLYPEPRLVRLYLMAFKGEARPGERRFAVILSDITRDRQDTEERIESERVSSILLLAAGVAHELGNPLNSLTIHLQLLERRLKKLKGAGRSDGDALADSVRVCREEVARLDGIISNFLGAIRPQPPDLAEIRVAEVLAEVLSFQQRELEDRGIRVEVEMPGDLPLVMADRNQLKQVFFNLHKNAMEAMEPGGRLHIAARADDDCLYLAIGDTGAGIKPENLARLFQPYHTTKSGGTGLGLMIVQRIMRQHGGQVGIESREGRGTVVTLQFPRKDRRVRLLR